jgi:hypothetical protein
MSEPAEQIAVAMLRAAYAHLPVTVTAGAIEKANIEPMRDILTAVTVSAYAEGLKSGTKRGREDLAREMEEDWKPVAQRSVRTALTPSFEEIQCRRNGCDHQPDYPGGPVALW